MCVHKEQGCPALTPLSRRLPAYAECLRTFQVTVVEETTGEVLEIPCRFCPNTNKYIIEPSSQGMRELFAWPPPLPRLGIMRRHQRAQLAPRHHLLHFL